MNRTPSYAERMAAPRGTNGVWARVEAAKGEWTADEAASAPELSYDYDLAGGRAGLDFRSAYGRLGFSVHMLRSRAEMEDVGEIVVNGTGFGVSAAWTTGGFYADVSAQATWLDAGFDALTPGRARNELEKEATGLAGSVGVEVGDRLAVMGGAIVVTPRLGLTWTMAEMGDFTDSVGSNPASVSVEDAESARGALGVTVEAPTGGGGLFGTLDVSQEFLDETGVEVGGVKLRTDVKTTSLRVGAGGTFAFPGNATMRASAWYRTSGSGADEYGAGVDVSVRF